MTAVLVDEISKRYQLGSSGGYRRLTESIVDAVRRRSGPTGRADELWALRDVSFEVAEGEVVGIVGRNGAGKSTLLKVLSRITEPTSGRAVLHGRMGSLLEVGTGFHPELSGRDNIYLNGAVLGMRKAEIARRFDEIVEFAEVERFLDTPVKRYSSGMYVRLAFAVAAHLEPEILVVDEVLAVGDSAFQKKCLGKMGDVARSGRTVLFVSHNMAAVRNLCGRAVLLEQGTVVEIGEVDDVLDRYLATVDRLQGVSIGERTDRAGEGPARAVQLRVGSDHDEGFLVCGEAGWIDVDLESERAVPNLRLSVALRNERDESVLNLDSETAGDPLSLSVGTTRVRCDLGSVPLMPGRYLANVYLESSGVIVDWVQEAATFDVHEGDFYGSGRLPPPGYGSVLAPYRWGAAGTRS
jgi:lipopolysaccharide transport system ATP-binding protein